jgi:chemotaxis protein MotB
VLLVLPSLEAEGCPQLALLLARHWCRQGQPLALLCLAPQPAVLRPEFEAPLASMLELLKPYAAKNQFAVEGHTDATPLLPSSQFASNWELSSARALVVRDRLEGIGIDRRKVRVEGYADTRPLPEAELANLSPEERNARLRRVVVRVF